MWKVFIYAALALALWLPAPASAATYYVAPGGADRAAGSAEAPWKTLIHAVNQLAPGDTLIVRPGNYEGFYIRKRNSGTATARVRILAEDGAVIDTMLGNAADGINIEYASHLDIEGFRITGAPRAGIRAVDCLGVRIRNNKVHDNGRWGIFTGFCDELLIENNMTWGSRLEHGIYVSNSAKKPVIRGNHIFSNAMNGIHTNGDASQGRDGMTTEALIENNIIYQNGRKGGAGINNDGIRNSIIRNNILYDNYANGITLYRIDGKRPSTNNQVLNNTIVMPRGEARSRWCIRIVDGSTRNTFKNNICINGHIYRGAIDISRDSLRGFVSDHNLLDGRFTVTDGESVLRMDEWRALTGQDKRSQAASYDELAAIFMDPVRRDFRPRPGGLAVNRGDPRAAPATDYAGRSRTVDIADIGALEYCRDSGCRQVSRVAGPSIEQLAAAEALVAGSSPGARDTAVAQAGPAAPAATSEAAPAATSEAAPAAGKPAAGAEETPEAAADVPAAARPRTGGCVGSVQSRGGAPHGFVLLCIMGVVVLRRRA